MPSGITHVGWLIDAKWDFFAIEERIGHASIKTTFDVYGHRLPHGDAERLAALDALLNPGKAEARKAKKTKKRKGKASARDQRDRPSQAPRDVPDAA